MADLQCAVSLQNCPDHFGCAAARAAASSSKTNSVVAPWGLHRSASALVGRVKQKLAPRGGLSAAQKRTPCDSMMERLMGNPIEVPCSLVVKQALKIWYACCGGSSKPVWLAGRIRA